MAPGANWLLVSLYLTAALMDATTATNGTQPAFCNTKCGGVEIPYPFGMGGGCYAEEYNNHFFNVSCNHTADPPSPFIGRNVNILSISLISGQLRVEGSVAYACYDREGNLTGSQRSSVGMSIVISDFCRFSHTQNKFVVLGCDNFGLIRGTEGVTYAGGCISTCQTKKSINETGGKCSGVGCCQTSTPRGLSTFNATIYSFYQHRGCSDFNPCGYAFLVDESNFTTFDVSAIGPGSAYYRDYRPPIVVDWSIGNQTCRQVQMDPVLPYACLSDHAECFDSNNGVGYNCRCKDGFEGNPYLQGGCRDVDECKGNNSGAICPGRNVCTNTEGGYNCSCRRWGYATGDPKTEPCRPILPVQLMLGLGIGLGLLLLMAIIFCHYGRSQRRKLAEQRREVEELKQRLFEQNGGLFLQELISSSSRVSANRFRIFTEEELAAATNGYRDDQIVGRGGHGIVYRGRLPDDGTEIAVKKSRAVDKRESKDFARETAILSQINHINVVTLVGCCLEVEIPMLVYEYVPCGTLYSFNHHHVGTPTVGHGGGRRPSPSMATRMRIATEAAEALAYLHSYASRPILHGDVKTTNILLDERHRAKVSDFGASTVAPVDKIQLATVM